MLSEGASALVVLVPEAEAVVGGWRERYDRSGVPAHVTILYPFIPAAASELAALFRIYPAFSASFDACGRLPGLLYLAPTPADPFRALTSAVTARWPTAQPYGGRYGDPVPHLTVAQEPSVFDEIEASLAGRLPVTTVVREVTRVVFTGGAWAVDQAFSLRT